MTSTLSVTPETQALIDDVRQWSLDVVRPAARGADKVGYPMTREELLAKCPIDISPIAFGWLDLEDEALLRGRPWLNTLKVDGRNNVATRLYEALCYGDGWPITLLPNSGLAEQLINVIGNDAQKERYVKGTARGDFLLSGWAMTEETGGNDVASIKTTAVKDGDHYVINGSKRFLSNGAFVDWTIVFATIDPALGNAGIRAFIVEKGTPGFHITIEAENKLGMRFNRQGAYRFENCRIPEGNFLRGEYDGSETMKAMNIFNGSRPFCGMGAVAGGQAAIDYAQDYLRARRDDLSPARWDRLVEEFAEMNLVIEEQRQLIYRAAWLNDHGLPDAKEAAETKVHSPRVSEAVILRCMQLMGPEAISEDHLLEKWYRDGRLCDIVEGTAHIQKMVISRQILGPGAARA